jgi:DNA-directed RNA polymerase sigma subunit (sigma70/sigma32)
LNRTRRVRLELQRILGRAPTNEEMANELDMSIEKYNKMIRLTRKAISLDMAKYQNNPKDIGQESETSLGDTIDVTKVIRDENSPEQSVDRVLFRDDLKEMLKVSEVRLEIRFCIPAEKFYFTPLCSVYYFIILNKIYSSFQ